MDMYTRDGELYHHGINGMKWGKKNGPPYPLSESQKSSKEKKQANYSEDYNRAHSGKDPKEMSTQELQQVNNRLNAEQQYDSLKSKDTQIHKAQTYVKEGLAIAGTAAAVITIGSKILKKGQEYVNAAGFVNQVGNRIVRS